MGEIVTFRAFSLRHLVEMKLLNTQFTIVCFDVALSVVTHYIIWLPDFACCDWSIPGP